MIGQVIAIVAIEGTKERKGKETSGEKPQFSYLPSGGYIGLYRGWMGGGEVGEDREEETGR